MKCNRLNPNSKTASELDRNCFKMLSGEKKDTTLSQDTFFTTVFPSIYECVSNRRFTSMLSYPRDQLIPGILSHLHLERWRSAILEWYKDIHDSEFQFSIWFFCGTSGNLLRMAFIVLGLEDIQSISSKECFSTIQVVPF